MTECLGLILVDPRPHSVVFENGQAVVLTPAEYDVLRRLADGRIHPVREFYSTCRRVGGSKSLIKVYMSNIRRAFREHDVPLDIVCYTNRGYQLCRSL